LSQSGRSSFDDGTSRINRASRGPLISTSFARARSWIIRFTARRRESRGRSKPGKMVTRSTRSSVVIQSGDSNDLTLSARTCLELGVPRAAFASARLQRFASRSRLRLRDFLISSHSALVRPRGAMVEISSSVRSSSVRPRWVPKSVAVCPDRGADRLPGLKA
jgi:hypothetical protein